MESALEQLIKMLSQIAPEVWHLALRQVWVDTILAAVIYVLFSIVTLVAVYGVKWIWKKIEDWDKYGDGRDFARIAVSILACVLLFIWFLATFFGLLDFILPRLLNPEWFAIKALSKLLPK